MPTTAPRVITPRLLLREWHTSDLAPFAALQADLDVRRYLGNGRPLSRDEAEEALEEFASDWARMGHGRWAVEEQASGHLIGYCGFQTWQEATADACPEIAYGFVTSAWGQGYATEAAHSSSAWALDALTFNRMVGLTHPDNVASQHVLEKCGLRYVGDAQGRYRMLRLYEAARSDLVKWLTARDAEKASR